MSSSNLKTVWQEGGCRKKGKEPVAGGGAGAGEVYDIILAAHVPPPKSASILVWGREGSWIELSCAEVLVCSRGKKKCVPDPETVINLEARIPDWLGQHRLSGEGYD